MTIFHAKRLFSIASPTRGESKGGRRRRSLIKDILPLLKKEKELKLQNTLIQGWIQSKR